MSDEISRLKRELRNANDRIEDYESRKRQLFELIFSNPMLIFDNPFARQVFTIMGPGMGGRGGDVGFEDGSAEGGGGGYGGLYGGGGGGQGATLRGDTVRGGDGGNGGSGGGRAGGAAKGRLAAGGGSGGTGGQSEGGKGGKVDLTSAQGGDGGKAGVYGNAGSGGAAAVDGFAEGGAPAEPSQELQALYLTLRAEIVKAVEQSKAPPEQKAKAIQEIQTRFGSIFSVSNVFSGINMVFNLVRTLHAFDVV